VPYPVTSAISSNLIALVFYVPFNDWYMNAATGQLNYLCSPNAWDDNSYVDPDSIADFTQPNWEDIQFMQVLTGQIIPYPLNDMEWINRAVGTEPSGLLPCDGGLYSAVSFPNLFALIGYTFGGSGGAFATPDLRGNTVINADDMGTSQGAAGRISIPWASATGGMGGGQTVLLDIAHMPVHDHPNTPHTHTLTPHVHSDLPALPNVTTIGAGAPQPTAIPGIGVTGAASDGISSDAVIIGDSGGSEPHENIQPSATMFYYIVAY
jgi:microcystin-dependent protein